MISGIDWQPSRNNSMGCRGSSMKLSGTTSICMSSYSKQAKPFKKWISEFFMKLEKIKN
jgi:hypothetical protein